MLVSMTEGARGFTPRWSDVSRHSRERRTFSAGFDRVLHTAGDRPNTDKPPALSLLDVRPIMGRQLREVREDIEEKHKRVGLTSTRRLTYAWSWVEATRSPGSPTSGGDLGHDLGSESSLGLLSTSNRVQPRGSHDTSRRPGVSRKSSPALGFPSRSALVPMTPTG